MPKQGLSTIKPLLKMLKFKPTDVSRGKAFNLLKEKWNDLEKKRTFIKLGIENSTDLVKDYCMDLINS